MDSRVCPYLDDLESRIDDDVEEQLFAEWIEYADGRFDGEVFSPRRAKKAPPTLEWPNTNVNDAQDDFAMMLLHQLSSCSTALARGTGAVLAVRCNYGTSIIPSLFGAEPFRMPREMDTLPTSRPLAGGKDAIRRLLDCGVPDLRNGLGSKVFDMAGVFLEVKATYPKIGRHVHLYHPDVQGPIDICEVLWGSSLFIDLVDEPDLVHAFLDLITETYLAFMRKWSESVPVPGDHSVHWSMVHRGKILLRDDSAMNLSCAMYDEFIKPYDQRLLDELGGGGIHFCGKGDHFIESASSMRGLTCVDMSQPEYNDLEAILRNTVDKGINLLQLQPWAVESAVASGRELRGRVHCWQWPWRS